MDVTASSFLFGLGTDDPLPRATTDAAGRFELEFPLHGHERRIIDLFAPGDSARRSARATVTARRGEIAEARLERHLNGTLAGVVVDAEGAPLVEVTVAVLGKSDVRGEERISDSMGRFQFAGAADVRGVVAERAGWRMVAPCAPKQAADCEWEDVRIVLVRAAALEVQVLAAVGAPLANVPVDVDLATGEPLSVLRTPFPLGAGGGRAVTGDDGVARFAAIWADLGLRVRARVHESTAEWQRERDGYLVAADTEGARAVLVTAEGERRLTLQCKQRSRLVGRVLNADGSAHARAHLRLANEVTDTTSRSRIDVTARADDQGRFDLGVDVWSPIGEALLCACSSDSDFFGLLPGDERGASASLRLNLGASQEAPLELVLRPNGRIAGRLVDADGGPLAGRVRLESRDVPLVRGRMETGLVPFAYAERDGAFRVTSLPAGRYDLVATNQEHAAVTVRGIEVAVGASVGDLVVRFDSPRACEVELSCEMPGTGTNEFLAIVGTLEAHTDRAPNAQLLPSSSTWRAPHGWPPWLHSQLAGTRGVPLDEGLLSVRATAVQGSSTVRRLDPGVHWFAAGGSAPDGRALASVGTGFVRLTEGRHHITFHMAPTQVLRGSVTGVGPEHAWHVALADDTGRFVELAARRETRAPTAPLSAHGEILLEDVPVGRYELRVGPRQELLAGRAVHVRTIDVLADEPAVVRVE